MATKQMMDMYAEFEALNDAAHGLGEHDEPAIGVARRFNALTGAASELFSDPILNNYKVPIHTTDGSEGEYAETSEYKQSVYTVTRLLHEKHLATDTRSPRAPQSASGGHSTNIAPSFNQAQTNDQTTSVAVEFNQTIISLTETLTKKEAEYADGTPEKTFIQRVKSVLAGAKGTMDVIRLILATAVELGLTVAQVHSILK